MHTARHEASSNSLHVFCTAVLLWTQIAPTQVSTLSKLQDGQGKHAPENLDRATGNRREDRGSPHENQHLSPSSPDIQSRAHALHSPF